MSQFLFLSFNYRFLASFYWVFSSLIFRTRTVIFSCFSCHLPAFPAIFQFFPPFYDVVKIYAFQSIGHNPPQFHPKLIKRWIKSEVTALSWFLSCKSRGRESNARSQKRKEKKRKKKERTGRTRSREIMMVSRHRDNKLRLLRVFQNWSL